MADKTLKTRFLVRRGTYNEIKNIVLANGEPGYDITNDIFVIGDGSHKFSELTTQVPQAEIRYNEIISRGENLVINGNGFMGNNTNFSALQFDGSNANGSPGSFTKAIGAKLTVSTDNWFPIVPNSTYEFTVDFKTVGQSHIYTFLGFYDVDKNEITASTHMYIQNTLTTLAQPLKDGDTIVYLTNLDNWQTGTNIPAYKRSFIIWNYRNSFGYLYPEETYSRHHYSDLYDINDSAVNKVTKTITLKAPWSHGTIPAGTKLSQGSSGGTFKYGWNGYLTDADWASYPAIYAGTDYSGKNVSDMFPPGTAYAKVGFLWNYDNNPNTQIWATNISVREIRERALTADHAQTAGSATTLSATLPISKGGTGGTTADQAMKNFATGVGSWSNYNPVDTERIIATNDNGAGTYTFLNLWEKYYKKKADILYLGIKDKAEDSKHADIATKTQQSLTVNSKQASSTTELGTYNGETALTINIPNDSIVFTDEYQTDSVVLKYIIVNGQAWKVAGNGISSKIDYEIIE